MSLHKYSIDFSSLSSTECSELMYKIENYSYTGLHKEPGSQLAFFFLDEKPSFNLSEIPASCQLKCLA